jgi:uncharacterized protein DUF3309
MPDTGSIGIRPASWKNSSRRHRSIRRHELLFSTAQPTFLRKGTAMGTILLIILILLLLGGLPTWPHSRNWGYGPSGGLGLVLMIVLILVLLKQI